MNLKQLHLFELPPHLSSVTEKRTDTRRKGDTNAPPDRHLDVTSSSNLAPLECWDCDQGISHLTAHAL